MLSNTAEYALRAVLYLAESGADAEGTPVRVDTVSEALDVPRNYLSKTLHLLAKRGVLTSMRGPTGGFRLAIAPDALHLHEVIEPFDPIETRRSCLLGRPKCGDEDPCAAHLRWKAVSERIAAFFRETTVADLLERPQAAAGVVGMDVGG